MILVTCPFSFLQTKWESKEWCDFSHFFSIHRIFYVNISVGRAEFWAIYQKTTCLCPFHGLCHSLKKEEKVKVREKENTNGRKAKMSGANSSLPS
jgi:hypothetical protein